MKSEKRHRPIGILIRVTPEERDALTLAAANSNHKTVAEYLRRVGLGGRPRAVPGVIVTDRDELRRLKIELGLAASTLRQIRSRVSPACEIADALRLALLDLLQTSTAIRQALGYERCDDHQG